MRARLPGRPTGGESRKPHAVGFRLHRKAFSPRKSSRQGRGVAARAWGRRARGRRREDAPGSRLVSAPAFPASAQFSGPRIGPRSAAAPGGGPTGNPAWGVGARGAGGGPPAQLLPCTPASRRTRGPGTDSVP